MQHNFKELLNHESLPRLEDQKFNFLQFKCSLLSIDPLAFIDKFVAQYGIISKKDNRQHHNQRLDAWTLLQFKCSLKTAGVDKTSHFCRIAWWL